MTSSVTHRTIKYKNVIPAKHAAARHTPYLLRAFSLARPSCCASAASMSPESIRSVDLAHKRPDAGPRERLSVSCAARFYDDKLAFTPFFSSTPLTGLCLDQCEFAASGADRQYVDHSLYRCSLYATAC